MSILRPGRLAALAGIPLICLGLTGGPAVAASVASPADALREAALSTTLGATLDDSPLAWYEAADIGVEGMGWDDAATTYSRLPARAKGKVTGSVWGLSHDTAGLAVRFVTDATSISALWDGGEAMVHMAATGVSGVDLYRRDGKKWIFCGVGRPKLTLTSATLASDLPAEPTEYLLYLPLYRRVKQLKIGIAADARIAPAPARAAEKPIVFYGTSITQGGCASRAGMCHPALVGRWLGYEVINLGFSGSGKMEPEMADFLNELDPALYVLECLPNMTLEQVTDRLAPFVRKLREKHPATPILLVENPNKAGDHPQNRELRKIFQTLQREKVPHLHYLPSKGQLDGEENGTVDGVHPTDLGFFRMAKAYTPVVKKILESSAR